MGLIPSAHIGVHTGKPVIHESVLQRKTDIDGAAYKPWILQRFKEGEYEIEPWDNQHMTDDLKYGMPIELGYRRNRAPENEC